MSLLVQLPSFRWSLPLLELVLFLPNLVLLRLELLLLGLLRPPGAPSEIWRLCLVGEAREISVLIVFFKNDMTGRRKWLFRCSSCVK